MVKIAVRAQSPPTTCACWHCCANRRSRPWPSACGDIGFPVAAAGGQVRHALHLCGLQQGTRHRPWACPRTGAEAGLSLPAHQRETAVFGIIGDPVAHSLSPLIHNRALRSWASSRVPALPRAAGRPADFLRPSRSPGRGLQRHHPAQGSGRRPARIKDGDRGADQAANTLVRGSDGFSAYNTDYLGMLDVTEGHPASLHATPGRRHLRPLCRPCHPGPRREHAPVRLRTGRRIARRVVLVLGAGGVARAVAHALHRREGPGDHRQPHRRSAPDTGRGGRLPLRGLGGPAQRPVRHPRQLHLGRACTPTWTNRPSIPAILKPGLVVFDTVYTPEQTLLIKEARTRGCPRHHRRGAVRPPGGAAVRAVHRDARPVPLFR